MQTPREERSVPAWKTYFDELILLGNGTPLWSPELTTENGGIAIGDVGYMEEGAFVRLFNISQAREAATEAVAENFDVGLTFQDAVRPPGALHSRSINSADTSFALGTEGPDAPIFFNSSNKTGAILVSRAATVSQNVAKLAAMSDHMLRHYTEWLEQARASVPLITLEDLILITGHDATGPTARLAFTGNPSTLDISFTPFRQAAHGSAILPEQEWGAWAFITTPSEHASLSLASVSAVQTDDVHDGEGHAMPSNCVFLRGFRMSERPPDASDAASMLSGTSMYSRLGLSADDISSRDPFAIMFDYLFRLEPDAERALVHDRDLMELMKAARRVNEGISGALRRLRPDVILNDRVATFSLHGLASKAASVASPTTAALQRKRASTQSLASASVSFQPHMKDVRELTVFTPIVSTPTVAAGEFSLFPSPSSASTSREESRGKGGRPGMVSSSPSFAADIDRGRKKNTTLSLFSNIGSWAKPRRESSPSVAPTPATPDLPLEDLIEALTPPAVQSPQQARALAQAISSQGVVIPFPQFNPIVSALCAPDAPAPCQVAGWDVLTAYWRRASEDASASTLGWPELLAHFSLISISQAWTLESWEPRHAALLAVISSPHGVLGLEQDLVLLLRLWIEGAFSRMTTGEIVSLEERSERERSVEVLSKHLISVLVNTQVASRLGQEVIDTLLLSFEHMIKSALTLDPQPMTSPAAVQSPAASGANSTPPRLPLHRRRQSSHITPLLSPGEATLKIPLDCIIDVYVSFLASQSARLSFKHLESTLPLLCRVLAYYNAPIPVPSAVIDAQSYPSSPYYKRVAEVLSSSFPGVHAMFARRIIRRCMFPSAEAKQDMLAAIQVSTGAFRVLRIFVRQTLRERLDARADAQGRSWTSSTEFTDEVDVNLGAYSFHPSQSGRALRDAIRAWLEIDCLGLSREPVLEEAAGIVNDVLNVFDARELPDMQSDEANAMGGALLEVAQYVKQFKAGSVYNYMLPLEDPKSAPTPFMYTLCTLLSRDTAHTPLEPPLTHILLSISEHLADTDASAIPATMHEMHALTPTSPSWLDNWRLLLMTPSMHSNSRPQTRERITNLLKDMYSILIEMPDYRRQLGAIVTEHIQTHAEHGQQETDDAVWKILSEEVVLRSTEIEHGPILYDEQGEVRVNAIHPDVESVLSFLEKASLETDKDMQVQGVLSSGPTVASSPGVSSSATSPSISRRVSDYNNQASLGVAVTAIASPSRSPENRASGYSLSVHATSALITAFSSLVFTPLSLGEHNLVVAVRIFRTLLDIMLNAKSVRSRLCALQFLMRMRADRDHRLHFAGLATNEDGQVQTLASQIHRWNGSSVLVSSPPSATSAATLSTPEEPPFFRPRGVQQSKYSSTSSNSRSRSRAPQRSYEPSADPSSSPLWRLPDEPPFTCSKDQSFSERLTSYDPRGPGRRVVLPLSDYVDAIAAIMDGEHEWEILSYVLCHLPSQLANKHLLCGPKCRTAIVGLLDVLCVRVLDSTFASNVETWPPRLHTSDASGLAYSTLTVFISYRRCFEPARQHRLVETFYYGLGAPPSSALTCLHALTLAAFELRPSMTKFLAGILDRLTQIMSNPQAPVHIINFLAMVGSLPELYANFTQDQFKKVFAVCLRYLQDFNRQSPSQKGSWALSQHVRLLSYAALYVWFLAINLSDRSAYITDITRGLLEANEGNAEVDEPTEVCFDWLARYTYASADPRPASSALDEMVMKSSVDSATSAEAPTEKTWVMGNASVVTVKVLPRRGWVEVIARRASGLTKVLARLENLPLVEPGDVDPDMLTIPGILMMEKDASEVAPKLLTHETQMVGESEADPENPPRPHPITGYVWSGTAPSQRRKDVTIDPSFLAVQLSDYPGPYPAMRGRLVRDKNALARFLRNFDRLPVIDTHKVGVLYVAPDQTKEEEILLNTHGSPAYTRFLEGLGRLMNLRDQKDVYTGELNAEEDGEYTYAWWDDIGQIVYHVATLMPSVDDPSSERRHLKKMHIGNDFVRIVWNDSGVPYAFDTLTTQIQFVNIVIEPHSAGTIGAFSADDHEHEYFRVTVQCAPRMEAFSPIGDFKLVSAQSLPRLVRQLSLHADWFSMAWQTTGSDTRHDEVVTNWRSRLQAIRRFAQMVNKDVDSEGVTAIPLQEGVLRQQATRDLSSVFS